MALGPMKATQTHTTEEFAEILKSALQGETVKSLTIDGDFYRLEFSSGHKLYMDHRLGTVYLTEPKPL